MRQMNVRYNARYLLSITYDDTSYLGGAHGYTGRCGHTFDIRTARELTLADLTDNYDAFLSAARPISSRISSATAQNTPPTV